MNQKKPIVVAVSGGFDPIHPGHIRMFKQAKALGDKLVVIVNNDNWVMQKKKFVFMHDTERKEVLSAIKYVDEVVITKHPKHPQDMSVSAELLRIRPDIFANGGDRHRGNVPEVAICQRIGCRMVDNVGQGGKIQSSSALVDHALKAAPRKVDVIVKNKKK